MIPNMAPPQATELEGQNDLSKGHEVVVMPNNAFGGMSVRDLVSSRNGDRPEPKPRRSRSAGRTVSRSRDIVQDAYDRMGVTRQDQSPQSTDVTSGRGRSEQVDPERERRARSLSRGRMQQRWQSAVTTRDPSPISQRPILTGSGPDKAAPLTPVPAPKPAATTTTPMRQATAIPVRQTPTSNNVGSSQSDVGLASLPPRATIFDAFRSPPAQHSLARVRQTPPSNNVGASQSDVGPASLPRTKISTFNDAFRSPPTQHGLARPRSFSRDLASNIERREYAASDRRDLPGSDRKRQSAASVLSHLSTPDLKDEKKEDDSDMCEESNGAAQRRLSIKDRISAYRKESKTGGTTSRPTRSSNTLSSPQYMSKREKPPQVDIYGTESDAMTGMAFEAGRGNTATSDAARAAVEAAPDPPVEKNNRLSSAYSVSAASVRSARTTGRVTGGYLAAVSPVKAAPSQRAYRSVPKSIPVVEINGGPSYEAGAADAQSLAASSVSGDEYLNSPKQPIRSFVVGLPTKKNSLKPDIHKYGSTRNTMTGMTISSPNNNYNSSTPTVDPEMEKAIEDRVQAQLSEMESRFEARLSRMETQMENQHKVHVDALEGKLDQLHSLLTKMATAATSESPSRSVAKKGPGDKKMLMLLSNQSGSRQQVADQERARMLFKVRHIDTQLLDGSDPTNKPRRDELFGISGIRANYPQFFLVGESITTFLGNFDVIESMNDLGTLTNDILGTS